MTELTARPLFSAFYPELAAFIQPLAGEVAARREFFDELPFATGYAIETSMLLHARELLGGTDGMAQVDLDVRHNYHQPLPKLGPMAYAVLRVVLERLRQDGRLLDDHAPPLQTADGQLIQVELIERPPYAHAARARVGFAASCPCAASTPTSTAPCSARARRCSATARATSRCCPRVRSRPATGRGWRW